MTDRFLSRREVSERSNLTPSTIRREQLAGRFPPYEPLAARRVGLRESIFNRWLQGRRDWPDSKG